MIEKQAYKGKWFLPTDADIKFDGNLVFTPENENHLEIHGSLQRHQLDNKGQSIIWGITVSHIKITLFNCRFRSSTNNADTSYSPSFILIGDHFIDEAAIIFSKFICRLYPLDDWISTIHYGQTKLWFENKLILGDHPTVISSLRDNLTLKIVFEKKFEEAWHFNRYVKQEVVSFIIFDTTSQVSFKDYLHLLYVFTSFLSFATGQESFPIGLYFRNEDITKSHTEDAPIQLLFQHTKIKSKANEILAIDMLFTFPLIQNQFDSILKNWFEFYEKHSICFEMFYEPLLNNHQFKTRHLLSIINALEALHRRIRVLTLKNKEHIQNLVSTMLSAVEDKKDLKFLKKRLKHFSEPNLLERLIDFKRNYAKDELQKIISNKDLENTVNIRNYYSHPDEDKENQDYLDIDCIYDLYRKNRLLLISIILRELKVEDEIFDQVLETEIQNYKRTAANTRYS